MQKMDYMKSEIVELTDAELDMINGGNWLGDAFRAIGGAISSAVGFIISGFRGPGDLRPPTRQL
jgi:lactobin A/cerein 7B family class IIb bacteriocin